MKLIYPFKGNNIAFLQNLEGKIYLEIMEDRAQLKIIAGDMREEYYFATQRMEVAQFKTLKALYGYLKKININKEVIITVPS